MSYRDIPHYHQLPNTCGLSSLLMVSKPEGNTLETLLTDISNRIQFGTYTSALSWQVVASYLLLKCCVNRSLGYHLRRNFREEFNYFKIIMFHQLEELLQKRLKSKFNNSLVLPLFRKRGIIRRELHDEYLFNMKTNLELKILAFLFGGSQLIYPNPDGTGCIVLDGSDHEKKLEILFQYVPEGVLLGSGYHWVAIQGMERVNSTSYKFTIHDPMGSRRTMTSQNVGLNNRFYLFIFDSLKRKKLDLIIRRALRLPKRRTN